MYIHQLLHNSDFMKRFAFYWLMTLVLPVALVSCADDEDDAQPSVAKPGEIDTGGGERLLVSGISNNSMNLYTYIHGSDGTLTYFGIGDSEEYDVTYNPMMMMDYGEFSYGNNRGYSFTLNGDGYATDIEAREPWDEYDYVTERSHARYGFSYDELGYLVRVTGEVQETSSLVTKSVEFSEDLVWENGNLVQVETRSTQVVSGEAASTSKMYVYEYGDTQNKYAQGLMAFDSYFVPDGFSFIGITGRGTTMLPKSCILSEWDGSDNPAETTSFDYSYTFNTDGTIHTERVNADTYTYAYFTIR